MTELLEEHIIAAAEFLERRFHVFDFARVVLLVERRKLGTRRIQIRRIDTAAAAGGGGGGGGG